VIRVKRSKKGIITALVRSEVKRSVRIYKGDRSLKVLVTITPRVIASTI